MPMRSATRKYRRHQLMVRFGKRCTECGIIPRKNAKPDEHDWLTVAHRVATRHGGTNDLENLRLVCTACHRKLDNMRRGGVYPDENYGDRRHLMFQCVAHIVRCGWPGGDRMPSGLQTAIGEGSIPSTASDSQGGTDEVHAMG